MEFVSVSSKNNPTQETEDQIFVDGIEINKYARKTIQAKATFFATDSLQLIKLEFEFQDLISVYFNCKSNFEDNIACLLVLS